MLHTLSLLPQGVLAVSHWLLVDLRIANTRIELLAGEEIDTWKALERVRITSVAHAFQC